MRTGQPRSCDGLRGLWLVALGWALVLTGRAGAEEAPVTLSGYVYRLEADRSGGDRQVAVEGALVGMKGTGNTVASTANGLFKLQLLRMIRPGQNIEVEVQGVGKWVLYQPADGRLTVPVEPQTVTLRLLPKGSLRFLEHEGLASLVLRMMSSAKDSARISTASTPGKPPPPLDLKEPIQKWASEYGLSLEQVQRAVDTWATEVLARRQKANDEVCLAHYAQRRFEEAARCFDTLGQDDVRALEHLRTQTQERTERAVQRFLRAADAHGSQYDFAAALKAYEQAAQWAKREVSPTLWAQVQMGMGIAHGQLGTRVEGEAAARHLGQAVDAFCEALTVRTKQSLPQDWAMTQNNLGTALSDQARRTEGEAGTRLLGQAVDAYREALKVLTKQALPQHWAMTQNNLGNALIDQASRTEGEAGTRLLGQAVDAFCEALTVRTKQSLPQDWAMTQNNLGTALSDQARRTEGEAGTRLLGQAVDAYREALKVLTKQALPQHWAGTQNNLGVALSDQARRTEGEAGTRLLGQAVDAYREALTVYTKQVLPQDWARTQNNLGIALRDQARRTEGEAGTRLLGQAVDAYREALKVLTKQALPQDWAMTQNNLGTALSDQTSRAEGEAGTRLLGQAVAAFREALTVYTKQALPQDWARTQNNLGVALRAQASRLPAEGPVRRELLTQAMGASREALTIHTRAVFPLNWAKAQGNLAEACALWPDERCAADGFAAVLLVYPDWQDGYREAYVRYHEKLFMFAQADALNQAWLTRHPDDVDAGAHLVESQLTTGRWTEVSGRLANVFAKVSPAEQVALLGIEQVALRGLDRPADAAQKCKVLHALVAGHSPGFRVTWTFAGTRHYLQTEPRLAAHREALLALLSALEQPDRAGILAALPAGCGVGGKGR